MNFTIDKNNHPIYLQIYRQLREDIISGVYPYNTKLPSKRLLADELSVSTITIEHSYALLCDEGYIESRERSGFVVIFRQGDGFAATEQSEVPLPIPIEKRNYPDFPFSVLAKTMRSILSIYGDAILEKTPNKGCVELREAIRRYLLRNKRMNVDIDEIVIGSGAEYLYGLIIDLLGRDRIYGIEQPSYEQIERIYRARETNVEFLPLSNDGIESSALTASNATVLHTTPYRSFPSGVSASATKLYEYIRWAEGCGRFIIEDDFESEFSVSKKSKDTLFSISKSDNIIYLNTFSKTISPALRIGYMVLPRKLVKTFEEKLGFHSCTVPTFEQLVIAELINSGNYERHINRVRRKIRKSTHTADA